MAWSTAFKTRLRQPNRPYAPMFRLLIGSSALVGRHVGGWEELSFKVLELLSHPGTATAPVAGSAGMVRGVGTWAMGQSYAYGVALTGAIKFGAQTVVPRTWIFTGPTLTVGVTRWGASMAMRMPQGMMTRLQIKLDEEEDSEWETIHIGMFKGMKWSGSDYTLSFSCALDIAKSNSTDPHDFATDEHRYKWFSGCGSTAVVSPDTVTDFTGGASISMGTPLSTFEGYRFGRTYKKTGLGADPVSFGGLEYHFGGFPALDVGGRQLNQWCSVRNTDGNDTFILYDSIDEDPTAPSSRSVLILPTSTSGLELPGYDGMAGDGTTGGIGAGSVATNVCVVHGTPVTEFVNTVYVQGYHHAMVPGIFAEDWGEVVLSRTLNLADITAAHRRFNWLFEYATFFPGHRLNCPFRAVFKNEVGDGVSEMKKRCGKWGVFPRFKNGGYGMAVIDGSGTSPAPAGHGGDPTTTNIPTRIIHIGDIEGAEFNTLASGAVGGMTDLKFTSTDLDATGTDFVLHDSAGGASYFGLPQLGQLQVATQDVAAGLGAAPSPSAWGTRYAEYFRSYLYQDFWQRNRVEAIVRLRGLSFAGLAPGDFVHVCIPRDPYSGAWAAWGPHAMDEVTGSSGSLQSQHVLDSTRLTGSYTEAEAAELDVDDIATDTTPWMVMSSHVDWIGCKVTLTLQRVTQAPASRDMDEWADSDLTDILGIVEPKNRLG